MLAAASDRAGSALDDRQLPRSGNASTAAAALDQALIPLYDTLGPVPVPFLLRSDNGLMFTSRHSTRPLHDYGLKREFITRTAHSRMEWWSGSPAR